MSGDTVQTSRALRSRDPPSDSKSVSSHVLRKTAARTSTVPSKPGRNEFAATGEVQGRFRSKMTDTLKLKLIAQYPTGSKTPSKNLQKPVVKKKTPPKPEVTVVTPVKSNTNDFGMAGVMNGFSQIMSSSHIPKSYMLYIGNLPLDITREQLEEHFRKTGGVKSVRIPKDKETDKGKGYAYMEFKDRISHGIALRLHQTKLAGRRINVEFTPVHGKKKEKFKRKIQALSRPKASTT